MALLRQCLLEVRALQGECDQFSRTLAVRASAPVLAQPPGTRPQWLFVDEKYRQTEFRHEVAAQEGVALSLAAMIVPDEKQTPAGL